MFEKLIFVEPERSLESAIESHYVPSLVWLSVFSAIFAAYTAFFVSEHIRTSVASKNIAWLVAGSTALGLGVWTMHMVPCLPINYR